jgi:peptide/nickel transport system substrate-binding protein
MRLMAIVAALSGLLALAGPASAAKDELVIGITQYPSTWNPMFDPMMAKSYIEGMTRRALVVYDPEWKLVCRACTELPTLENGGAVAEELEDGKKGVAVTYTIRPEATWGDGTPVTTADVVFGWEVGRHPLTGVAGQEPYRRVTRIDVKDAKTFTLHIDKLRFDYSSSDLEILPAHLERAAFADPAQYRTRTKYDTEPTNPGLWSGPYMLTETAAGSHVVLEPNPHWKGQKPAFRRIVVKAIENTAALEANLLSGGIDMIAGEVGLSLDQALAFEKRNSDKFQVLYKPGLVYEHVELNLDQPFLSDKRVRQALLWGLDREAIAKQLFAGKQPVADSFVNPLDWGHSDAVARYKLDLPKAKAQLDQAGWKPGAGGIRQNGQGDKLSFELMTTAGNRSRELVQQVIQNQWRQLGIEVRIRNEPPRVLFGETVNKRKFAVALFAWISAPESPPRTTLHSTEIPAADNSWRGQNTTGYKNPEMDRLIDAIEVELDRDKRKALWAQIQQIYAEDLPALPLFFRADSYILPKWLKGVTPTGHQFPSTLWVENWRAE